MFCWVSVLSVVNRTNKLILEANLSEKGYVLADDSIGEENNVCLQTDHVLYLSLYFKK